MQIGKMNTRIVIEEETITRNTFGEELGAWNSVAEVFAKQRQLTGSERFTEEQELSMSRTEFYIRYIPALSVKNRVVVNEKYKGITLDPTIYKIESIANIDGKNVELKLLCSRIEV